MPGFIIQTEDYPPIRFKYYIADAPLTSRAFGKILPFTQIFIHARTSGEEFWTPEAPLLDIIQENASVFTLPGEVVIGPSTPARVKTAACMGIYYGEGKGLDAANIFAKVMDEDLHLLKDLGLKIWREGQQKLTFRDLY